MNNMFKSIKMAFKTKNIFCRILIFLWVIFCAFMTLVFFIGSAGSMGADDISVILLLYYFASTAFLMPAVSIAQGVKAVNNQKNIKFSRKSWGLTLVLSLFLGHLGGHRFYAGKKATGVLYIFSAGGFGVGWITDIILILMDRFTDKNGRIISRTKRVNGYAVTLDVSKTIQDDSQQRKKLMKQAVSVLQEESERKRIIADTTQPTVLAINALQNQTTTSPIKSSDGSDIFAESDQNRKKEAWENGGREKLAQWRNEHQKGETAKKQNDYSLFSEITVSGSEEKSQVIPSRTIVSHTHPTETPTDISVTIATNTPAIENDAFDFDFDSSYSGYSSHDKFIKDMKKFEDKVGIKAPFVPFMQYWPTYDSMDRRQKAWYFYWRTEVRNGRYPDTDLSYIFVHIYEILSGCGWKEANVGYNQLIMLWEAYKERFPKLDNYLFDWTHDFAQLHNLYYSIPEGSDLRLPSQPALRDMLIERHREDKPLKLSFLLVDALCDYSIVGSKFYKDGNQMLMRDAIPRVVALADAALLKKKGKGILELYGPNRTRKQTYYAFQSAVCPHANERIEIAVRAYTSSHKLRTYINELVRYAENVLRELYGYRGRLRGVELDPETAALVRSFLKKEYSPKAEAPVPQKKVEINLDLAAIETLRAESNAVRDALEVTEEAITETRMLTDLNEVTGLINALSGNATSFLYSLFTEKWSGTVDTNNKGYVEEINRCATQCLARELIVIENGFYIVEDDYRDELEHIFTTNPDIIKKSPETNQEVAVDQSSTKAFFNTTTLSEGLQNVIGALTDLQQEVLWAIVALNDPQDHINSLADEAMTMPEILIDEINDIASQEIDDILIDTFNDTMCILEQYEQELKDAVIAEVE